MASVAIVPTSGNITAKQTVCRITVSAADANDLTAYNSALYPSSPEFRYYLLFDAPSGTDDKKSYKFNVNDDGEHIFNNFIYDVAGSWTIRFRNAANDSDVATAAVTVA